MLRSSPRYIIVLLSLTVAVAEAQAGPSTSPSGPVSYSSVTQLNEVLAGLERASQTTQIDLARLRIEKWKTDGTTKRQSAADVESIQKNLQTAVPDIVAQLRNSPESLPETFRLYRNLDALYDVFSSIVESSGAFGSKDEFQSLQSDLNAMEGSRRSIADRMEALAGAKENELAQLRTQLRTAQAAVNAAPPKKVVVDDTEPVKKPVKRKTTTKKVPPAVNPTSAPATAPTSASPPQ